MLLRLRLMPIALLMFGLVLGCGDKPPATTGGGGTDPGTKPSSKKPLEKLASTGWGTIEGKITFDGEPPTPRDLTPQINMKESDAPHCKMGKTVDETWVVGGADKGVANVVVWLRAPKGKYFDIPEKLRDRSAETITLAQPYCAFEPHVFALFPSYYDGDSKKQKPTNQKFHLINDATIAHNSNVDFSDNIVNPEGGNNLLPPRKGDKMEGKTIQVKAGKDNDAGSEQSLKVKCDIHGWMGARGRIFDHPFFAVTTGGKKDDKEFGSYKIENAPAGVELDLVYWHESMDAPKVLKKITLKDKETTKEDFKVK